MDFISDIRSWSNLIVLVLQGLFTLLIWVLRKSFATKDDVAGINGAIAGVDKRVSTLEQVREGTPTTQDLNSLRLEMEQFRGSMATFAARIQGEGERWTSGLANANAVFDAKIAGAIALVERTERMVGLITEHMIATPRSR